MAARARHVRQTGWAWKTGRESVMDRLEVTETAVEGLRRELKVIVGADELKKRLSDRLEALKGRVQLKGFRPGKVPVAHIRKIYGKSLMAEVLEEAVNESSRKAITDREERPAFQPKISLTEDQEEIASVLDGRADLAYSMAFEILPSFELTDLAKLSLTRYTAEPDAEEIDKAVERLREGATSFETAEDRAAEDGDRVTVDFVGKIDGEAFDGGTAEDAQVVIGKGGFIPGFEEGMIGARAGDERVVEATFPSDYSVASLAGKTAQFETTVKEVAAPKTPDLDDEFAASMGFDDIEKLREAVKDRLQGELDEATRNRLRRDLLNALNESHDFELPPTLVEDEFEDIWRQYTEGLERSGKKLEELEQSEEDLREKYRKLADRRVRLGLVLSEIGEKNEISVSEEEMSRAIAEQARRYPGQEQLVYEHFRKHPERLAELRAPLFEDKVVDFILELAKVDEQNVTPEELFAAFNEDEGEDGEESDQ